MTKGKKYTEVSSFHSKAYGQWAGNNAGRKPDPARCCVEVTATTSWVSHQCSRRRGYGPEEAYCKQHDPAAVKARDDAAKAKYKAQVEKEKPKWFARDFLAALREIAAGHNNPRDLAQSIIDKYEGKHQSAGSTDPAVAGGSDMEPDTAVTRD